MDDFFHGLLKEIEHLAIGRGKHATERIAELRPRREAEGVEERGVDVGWGARAVAWKGPEAVARSVHLPTTNAATG